MSISGSHFDFSWYRSLNQFRYKYFDFTTKPTIPLKLNPNQFTVHLFLLGSNTLIYFILYSSTACPLPKRVSMNGGDSESFCIRNFGFGPKIGQIDPKWDKSQTFQIRFQTNVQKSKRKKSRISDLSHLRSIWSILGPYPTTRLCLHWRWPSIWTVHRSRIRSTIGRMGSVSRPISRVIFTTPQFLFYFCNS